MENNKQEFENLASMIKQGFDAVDARFEQVDKRFEQMETRFDKKFLGLENRLDFLEEGQEEIKSRLNNVAYRHELQNLDKRVVKIEKKLGLETV